ncbi:MAG: MSCRAMM family adhesin SdrC, partial [Candidatus Heimdallarchaeota archaeon]|nr:MSCRAMM family adhesin SdrC [Candidatus Heimdallarchaeota archaeon]
FITSFFFGLIFLVFTIIGGLGDEDSDVDSHNMDGHDFDADTDFDMDGHDFDVDTDFDMDGHDFDADTDFDMDGHDFDADTDFDMDGHDFDGDLNSDSLLETSTEHSVLQGHFDHLPDQIDAGIVHDAHVEKSNYMMGNIAVFTLIFGQVGWSLIDNLQDWNLFLAIMSGYFISKLFAYIIANYAKTVIVPIKHVSRGDIATVQHSVTKDKAGMVHIKRRDGYISTELAIGAFPHDNFSKGEKGYVWAKKEQMYLITRGHSEQPTLSKLKNKKAIDILEDD